MTAKSKTPADSGDQKPAEGGKNHSDVPIIVFVGNKIVDLPYTVQDYQRLVSTQTGICHDMHGLEEVEPTLKRDIFEAETALREARANLRLNEQCIAEMKDELVRVTEAAAKGVLREQRQVREEFLKGEISIFDIETGALVGKRNATDKEHAKAMELRGVDGKPITGNLLEPDESSLPPTERAKRKIAAETKGKRGASAEPEAPPAAAKPPTEAAELPKPASDSEAPAARERKPRPSPVSLVPNPPASE